MVRHKTDDCEVKGCWVQAERTFWREHGDLKKPKGDDTLEGWGWRYLHLGMREHISKYGKYKKRSPGGSALSVNMIAKEDLLESICDEDLSQVPRSDATEAFLIMV